MSSVLWHLEIGESGCIYLFWDGITLKGEEERAEEIGSILDVKTKVSQDGTPKLVVSDILFMLKYVHLSWMY